MTYSPKHELASTGAGVKFQEDLHIHSFSNIFYKGLFTQAIFAAI